MDQTNRVNDKTQPRSGSREERGPWGHYVLQGIAKEFGNPPVHALKDVALEVHPGEFLALMGPSGCGKSTLLNVMGTIDTPTGGTITLDGVDLGTLDEGARTRLRRHRIGFVFQFFNLLPTLSVLENVTLPLELQGERDTDALRQRGLDLLDRVGLSHRVDAYPATLSGGEMQRVALSRALIHQPQVLLADEPTGNLDTESGDRVLDLLVELSREEGMTVVMATHSMEAASRANRIIGIRDGVVVPVSNVASGVSSGVAGASAP